MFVTYSPEGEQPRTWEFDPLKVRESQGELIEKRFGDTFDKFRIGLVQGASRARRVVLWHLLTREHHTLRYEDAPDPYKHELKVEFSRAELETIRGQLAKAKLDEAEREQMLAALDAEIDKAPVGGEGKASSNSDA